MDPNSPRKNAFTYFVEEYEAEQIARGRKIKRKDALSECTANWGQLDPETRLRYCNMANPMLDLAGKPKEKTPPNMEWLDPVTGEYGEKWFRYVRSGDELHYLRNTITSEKKLKRFSFYLVHCNYFCKPSLKKYVPAELALVEFNLAEGIKNVYHTLINPGSIPLGFAHEAKRLSEEGHGIPVPPHSKGEKQTARIIEVIKRFMKYGTALTGKFPPLFTVTDNVLPAMHMLNDMVPYNEDQPVFTVYPAHRMFFWIKNKCSDISGKGVGFADESVALKEIERDCFRYIVEIACDFHKQSESSFPMCSQSIVKRLAFTICDHCCRDLNITLVGGRHVHGRFRDSSPDGKPQDEEQGEKDGKDNTGEKEKEKEKEEKEQGQGQGQGQEQEQEQEPENSDEMDEETALERSLAKHCNCGEIPEFVGGYSTKEVPNDDMSGLSQEEIRQFYNAFMHNMMEGKVEMADDNEEKKDQMYLNVTEGAAGLSDNPFAAPQAGSHCCGLPTAAEEVEAYRQNENRRMRNMIIARQKAREARESRETFESKIAEVVKARTQAKEPRLDDNPDQ